MEYTNNNSVQNLLDKYFDPSVVFQGRKMVDQGRVSLSFMKGSLQTYLIVSGIVAENNTNYESKVSLKHVDGTEKFTTNCSCILPQPCHHAGSLLLKFSDIAQKQEQNKNQPLSLSLISQEGVHVNRYGTLIKSAPLIP